MHYMNKHTSGQLPGSGSQAKPSRKPEHTRAHSLYSLPVQTRDSFINFFKKPQPSIGVFKFSMAGMLPGVECARRRRSGGWADSPARAVQGRSRRSSFCLYATKINSSNSSSLSVQRSTAYKAYEDDKLGVVAREAKERLDERLRTKRKSDPDRRGSGSSGGGGGGGGSYSKRLSWASRLMSWKTSDLGECAVCLDHFRAGETLVHLPCAHRFHSNCLVPWLQNHARCPCCRMNILAHEITT